ncbi:hypothetical protein D3C81_1120500 [compost metagenome]
MEELTSLLLAGALIPTIAIIVRKLIVDKVFEKLGNEILVKDKNGKELKFITNSSISSKYVRDVFESELNFEAEVKKNIHKFIGSHSRLGFKLSSGKNIDFILSRGDKMIGIEAKSNADIFKAKWISDYFKESDDIDELIMIVNSKIPAEYIDEVKKLNDGKKVIFISAPRGKEMYRLLNNVLVIGLGINK